MKDKIKLCDCLRWADVNGKFKCFRCGVEHEDKRVIKRGKDYICPDCIKAQGLFAIANKIQEVG